MNAMHNIWPGRTVRNRGLKGVSILLFLLLFTFPLLPLKVANILVMFWALFSVAAWLSEPSFPGRQILRNLVFVIPFLPYFLEWLISGGDPAIRFEMEKKLLLLCLPLIFPFFLKISGFRSYRQALMVFTLSVISLLFITLIAMLAGGDFHHAFASDQPSWWLRTAFESRSQLHPTYASAFALAALCFMWAVRGSIGRTERILCLIGGFIIVLSLIVIAARISFVIALALFVLMLLRSGRPWWQRLLAGFVIAALLASSVWLIPPLRERFAEFSGLSAGGSGVENTITRRAVIMGCGLQVFADHWLCGTGSAASQGVLNGCYSASGMTYPPDQDFNAHNQYLTQGINYGTGALLLFLGMLVLWVMRCRRIPEALFFILIVLMVFTSESILERQHGVYFFTLITLLIWEAAGEGGRMSPDRAQAENSL